MAWRGGGLGWSTNWQSTRFCLSTASTRQHRTHDSGGSQVGAEQRMGGEREGGRRIKGGGGGHGAAATDARVLSSGAGHAMPCAAGIEWSGERRKRSVEEVNLTRTFVGHAATTSDVQVGSSSKQSNDVDCCCC
ncbi:hypothetical protein EJ05DRAFT_355766 [Pseudovirgaria hyperparasitica]|uniref:Uncharacterized protein n=1 Tax=Pseudovirgaria hyperparasitica TaxID=470096 RepID=A0A6A6W968_9PEZI|nr:uncharacterized protein EJ05DRAFT_355766 [Pseudovirgaria hyperparasitica]KAF2758564.1 hypothetical protein EJ05DRAFT_355766 [Pseudovirgaria hyperparasitica]